MKLKDFRLDVATACKGNEVVYLCPTVQKAQALRRKLYRWLFSLRGSQGVSENIKLSLVETKVVMKYESMQQIMKVII